jgi:hypothetical protein
MHNVLDVRLETELRPQLDWLAIELITDRKIGLAHPKIFVISQKLHTSWSALHAGMRVAATARTNGTTVRQREIYRAIGKYVI